jgi:uncharacterized protein YuzE
MKVTYDGSVDAAYIYLADSIAPGGVKNSIHLTDELSGLHVDLAGDGRVLGIEVLSANDPLPREAIANAEKLGPPMPAEEVHS